jgi:hypothetical protein
VATLILEGEARELGQHLVRCDESHEEGGMPGRFPPQAKDSLRANRGSGANELDVAPRGDGERFEIVRIRSDDSIAVSGEKYESSVDDVVRSRVGEELSCASAEAVVETLDVHAAERPSEERLACALAAPNLADHPTVRHRNLPGEERGFEPTPHRAIVTFESNERAAVEHEPHAARPRFLRLIGRGRVRTTTAFRRSARS